MNHFWDSAGEEGAETVMETVGGSLYGLAVALQMLASREGWLPGRI